MSDQTPTLYRHSKRPKWGPAIIASETGDHRSLQFQDGKLRTFRRGFYHLLEEVDLPLDRATALRDELEGRLGMSRARRKEAAESEQKGRARPIRVDEQIAYFLEKYPLGFDDPAYMNEIRGVEGKVLKRHREPACARAAQLLTAQSIAAALEQGRAADVISSLTEALAGTDLVAPKRRQQFARLSEEQMTEVATALFDLLWGEDELVTRFSTWAAALSRLPEFGWRLATTPAALVHPTEHVPVTPTTFTQQARWMAPKLKLSSVVDAGSYLRSLQMAKDLQVRLEQGKLQPRDLIDVFDFSRLTLSGPARKEILAIR